MPAPQLSHPMPAPCSAQSLLQTHLTYTHAPGRDSGAVHVGWRRVVWARKSLPPAPHSAALAPHLAAPTPHLAAPTPHSAGAAGGGHAGAAGPRRRRRRLAMGSGAPLHQCTRGLAPAWPPVQQASHTPERLCYPAHQRGRRCRRGPGNGAGCAHIGRRGWECLVFCANRHTPASIVNRCQLMKTGCEAWRGIEEGCRVLKKATGTGPIAAAGAQRRADGAAVARQSSRSGGLLEQRFNRRGGGLGGNEGALIVAGPTRGNVGARPAVVSGGGGRARWACLQLGGMRRRRRGLKAHTAPGGAPLLPPPARQWMRPTGAAKASPNTVQTPGGK